MTGKIIADDKRSHPIFVAEYGTFIKYYVIFAVMYKVFTVYIITLNIVSVINNYANQPDNCTSSSCSHNEMEIYLWGMQKFWIMSYLIVQGIMDVKLFKTCLKPNPTYLRLYVIVNSLAVFAITVCYILVAVHLENEVLKPRVYLIAAFITSVSYKVLSWWGILHYANESESEIMMQSQYRPLTREEVRNFEHGQESENSGSILHLVQSQAYNSAEFEIDRNELDLREASFLGRGEYGLVYKVHWNGINVALKTVDPELSDVNQFTSLLSEAKVMMAIGRHDNVVQLLGLCTDRIVQRDLYIICELCEFGNLHAFLRSERHAFSSDFNDTEALTSRDLLKWCMQIAAGMEFLSSKRIIHGDLATRNVLLTEAKIAKVTDFGLSRRLYNYSVYHKRKNVPLPWRWLAFESLVDLSFSRRSDVWAYGITCWEIFELGALPWPQFESFVSDFIESLRDGNVPRQSANCTDDTYVILKSCWDLDPYQRPDFTQLKFYFSAIVNGMG